MLSWLWFSMKFKYKLYVILHLKFIIILKLNESKKKTSTSIFSECCSWFGIPSSFYYLTGGDCGGGLSSSTATNNFMMDLRGGELSFEEGEKMKANQKLCSLWLQHYVIFRWCLTIWLNFTTKFFLLREGWRCSSSVLAGLYQKINQKIKNNKVWGFHARLCKFQHF